MRAKIRCRKAMNVKLDPGAYVPKRAHVTDAGYDLCSPVDAVVPAQRSLTIDTGVHVEIPRGCCGLLVAKSGMNVNKSILSTGLIDSAYTGSVRVKLYNHSRVPYEVKKGDKISQLVILPIHTPDIVLVSHLAETERGDGGFGSTGR